MPIPNHMQQVMVGQYLEEPLEVIPSIKYIIQVEVIPAQLLLEFHTVIQYYSAIHGLMLTGIPKLHLTLQPTLL